MFEVFCGRWVLTGQPGHDVLRSLARPVFVCLCMCVCVCVCVCVSECERVCAIFVDWYLRTHAFDECVFVCVRERE